MAGGAGYALEKGTVEQLADSLTSLDNLHFTADELTRIDSFATEGGIDLWRVSSTL